MMSKKVFKWGVITAVLFWFAESFIHAYVFKMNTIGEELFPISDANELWMRMFICISFMIFGFFAQRMINNLSLEKRRVEKANVDLEKALNEIKTLQGILPICASCKKIRDDRGYWNQIERYISQHTTAQFSHGLCPDCYRRAMEEIEEFEKKENK